MKKPDMSANAVFEFLERNFGWFLLGAIVLSGGWAVIVTDAVYHMLTKLGF